MDPFLVINSSSFPYSFILLRSLNNFLASRMAQKRASTFFSITLSPFLVYWYFRNRHAYWMALQNLSRPSADSWLRTCFVQPADGAVQGNPLLWFAHITRIIIMDKAL